MKDHPYVLQMPLGKGHHFILISNRKMELRHFELLDRYLALQKATLAEDESAVPQGDAQPEPSHD